MSCYFFVISSKDLSVFDKLNEKRRKLFKKYNLDYSILINESNHYTPLQEDEILYPLSGTAPHMSLKFIHAVKLFFRSFKEWEDVPQYIIRTNASVYIHYPTLLEYLQTLPKERVLAGPYHHGGFTVGMLMIFSKDVLFNMIKDSRIYEDTSLMKLPDDVCLSKLARPYIDSFTDMMSFFMYPGQDENGIYNLQKVDKEKKWLYLIRFDRDRNYFDVQNWKNLMAFFDNESE